MRPAVVRAVNECVLALRVCGQFGCSMGGEESVSFYFLYRENVDDTRTIRK
jgi:hypothetical protein